MSKNMPTAFNRNGARPKYELLCVDCEGYHWLWRTTDDAVFVIDGSDVRRRLSVANRSPEALVARVAGERGVESQHHAPGTFGDYLVRQLGGGQ